MRALRLITSVLIIYELGSLSTNAEYNRIGAADWNRWYDRLFGDDDSYSPDVERALRILIWLETESYDSIADDRRRIVQFWYDANVYNGNHCNDSYKDLVLDRYTKHVPRSNNGIDVLFDFTYYNLLDDCDTRFVDLYEAVSTGRGLDQVAKHWKQLYQEVFGELNKNLVETTIMRHMMFMHKTLVNTDLDSSITDDMKDTVHFWYHSLLIDAKPRYCNKEHINTLRQRSEVIQYPQNTNLIVLLNLIHQSLVESCSDLYLDLNKSLNIRFGAWQKSKLERIQAYYQKWTDGKISKERMEQYLVEQLGVDDSSSDSAITQVWKRGPCKTLKAFLSEQGTKNFSKFVKLVNYGGLYAPGTCPLDTILWAKIIYACKKLELMTDVCNQENLAKATLRRVRSCFG